MTTLLNLLGLGPTRPLIVYGGDTCGGGSQPGSNVTIVDVYGVSHSVDRKESRDFQAGVDRDKALLAASKSGDFSALANSGASGSEIADLRNAARNITSRLAMGEKAYADKERSADSQEARRKDRAIALANKPKFKPKPKANMGGYTSFADLFDGGGPGKSGAVFGSGGSKTVLADGAGPGGIKDGYITAAEAAAVGGIEQNLISSASNFAASGGIPGALVKALQGGFNANKSVEGSKAAFRAAFAAARKAHGGDGGTFMFGGEKFLTDLDPDPTVSENAPAVLTGDYSQIPAVRETPEAPYGAATGLGTPATPPLGSQTPALPFGFLTSPYGAATGLGTAYTTTAAQPMLMGIDPASIDNGQVIKGYQSVLGPDYPPSTFEAGMASHESPGQGYYTPAYTSGDSNFISTEEDDLFAPIGAQETLGERYKRQRLDAPGGGIATLPGSYESVALGDTGWGSFLNDYVLGGITALDTTPKTTSGPYFPALPTDDVLPPNAPDNSNFNYAQAMLEAGVNPVKDASGNFQPTPVNPFASYRDEYEYDPLDDRLEFNRSAILGALQTAGLSSDAVKLATTKNLPTGLEAMAGGLMPEDRFSDVKLDAPLAYGPQYQQDTVVAELAKKAKGIVDEQIDRVKSDINEPTKAALSREIMKGWDPSTFDPEAFAVQAAQVIGGIVPIIVAGGFNPGAGMAIGGAATAGDVAQVVDQQIRKREEEGHFGDINPRSLDGIIQVAQQKALGPSAALGAAGACALVLAIFF